MAKAELKTSTLSTLGGVFQPPILNYKRNFLRENKQNVREIQKMNSEKQQLAKPAVAAALRSDKSMYKGVAQRSQNKYKQQQQQMPNANGAVVCRHGNAHPVGCRHNIEPIKNTPSIRSFLSKTDSANKEVQTEDIKDEEFLYDALKKCTLNDVESVAKRSTHSIYDNDSRLAAGAADDYDQRSNYQKDDTLSRNFDIDVDLNNVNGNDMATTTDAAEGRFYRQRSHSTLRNADGVLRDAADDDAHENDGYGYGYDGGNDDAGAAAGGAAVGFDNQQQLSARSQHSMRSIASNASIMSKQTMGSMGSKYKHLQQNKQQQQQQQQQQKIEPDRVSLQSRRTMRSTLSQHSIASKKSTGSSLHQLGSRDDLKLPAYLEREKKEKEEKRLVEKARDPLCPPGHTALTESERLSALRNSETKYQTLIMELNRMPMTNETLRMRTRKTEIEKELVSIETDIRLFSKPKVYIKNQ